MFGYIDVFVAGSIGLSFLEVHWNTDVQILTFFSQKCSLNNCVMQKEEWCVWFMENTHIMERCLSICSPCHSDFLSAKLLTGFHWNLL